MPEPNPRTSDRAAGAGAAHRGAAHGAITGSWDGRISRRTLLRTGGSLAAGVVLAGTLHGRALAQAPDGAYPFALGVASGDPGPRSVVLWTRLAPEPLVPGGGLAAEPYAVRYEVARDEGFHRIVRRGTLAALPEEAHSARVELAGLRPSHEYFYRFTAGAEISPIGRTRTAPRRDDAIAALRFAFVSCQNYAAGYFSAYADVVAADLDAVVHLGDYIYEGGLAEVRAHLPARELRSLDDYRIRHGQYKTDADLQAAHAAFPWLVTWDDHEVENNYAGLDSDPDTPPEVFARRRANAYRAYWEHMPLSRARKPVGPDLPLYRRFRWGTMATFNVLDTRQHRSDQPAPCTPEGRDASGYCPEALAAGRTMLGGTQRDWLFADLAAATTRWNVLAQQTAVAPWDQDPAAEVRDFGKGETWDGYVAERQQLLDWIVERRTANVVVITGDSHANWVRNVPPDHLDFGVPPIATEFMGTSVSSGGDPETPYASFGDDPGNPHIVFRNNNRGYVHCTLTDDTWISDYRIVPTVLRPGALASTLASFVVDNGRPGAQLAGTPAV